ncbi:hypothetical protein CLF_107492 [Clonorchis sinensis]|uniref:ER membrane protein complex subunit 1 n=1 Tax=Clonorchis sinensis TaxID=79923 RepID=G7YGW0_CLOSI|nr:hypothetical protein CLF_107492 [Clonorchis sinensis]
MPLWTVALLVSVEYQIPDDLKWKLRLSDSAILGGLHPSADRRNQKDLTCEATAKQGLTKVWKLVHGASAYAKPTAQCVIMSESARQMTHGEKRLSGTIFVEILRRRQLREIDGPMRLRAMMFTDSAGALSFRLLLQTEDHAIQLVRQNGQQQWLRDESLADIVAVEMVDLPVSESQAKMEEEFGHSTSNIFEMFAKRLHTQLAQLWVFIRDCAAGFPQTISAFIRSPSSFMSSFTDRRGLPTRSFQAVYEDAALPVATMPPRLRHPLIMANETVDGLDPAESPPIRNMMNAFLTRDNFNLHKMIVVATSVGKLFGLESEKGRVVWEHLVPSAGLLANGKLTLYQQRNTAHFPLPPITTLLLRSKDTSTSFTYYRISITVGDLLRDRSNRNNKEHQKQLLTSIACSATVLVLTICRCGQAVLHDTCLADACPGEHHWADKHFVMEISSYCPNFACVDSVLELRATRFGSRFSNQPEPSNCHVHIYPSRYGTALVGVRTPVYMYTIEPDLARLTGYRVHLSSAVSSPRQSGREDPVTFKATRTWRMQLRSTLPPNGNGEQNPYAPHVIVAAASRPNGEHIHSVGRVLGDRSVLYKYLNPNLIAVVTAGGSVASQTNSIAVYLIDVVVGRIVYSAINARCSEPVNLVHSENWIVYTYYNHQSLRHEVTVLELYEPTNYSPAGYEVCASYSVPANSLIPQVVQQSYIFSTAPTPGVAAVSLTERGITSKSIIFGLQKGSLIELPKTFFDPRRALDLSPELMEEGVLPYTPVLPLSDQAVISYNQTIMGVRAIRTAATGLESTSLVFAYGLADGEMPQWLEREFTGRHLRLDFSCLGSDNLAISQPSFTLLVDGTERVPQLNDSQGLGDLALAQPSCNLRMAWQLGKEGMLQLNGCLGGRNTFCHLQTALSSSHSTDLSIKFSSRLNESRVAKTDDANENDPDCYRLPRISEFAHVVYNFTLKSSLCDL